MRQGSGKRSSQCLTGNWSALAKERLVGKKILVEHSRNIAEAPAVSC
jgi:hypothetical protein